MNNVFRLVVSVLLCLQFQLEVLMVLAYDPNPNAISSTFKWVPASRFDTKNWNQELSGIETNNNGIFIGRLPQGEGHLVGEYNYRFPGFYTVLENKTISYKVTTKNLEILTYPYGAVSWSFRMASNMQKPPHNLILVGFDHEAMEPLYICRITGWDMILMGVYKRSEPRGCRVVRGDEIFYNKEMEVMTLSLFGIALNSVD